MCVMRYVALFAVAIAAAGCTEPPTWDRVGRDALFVGANVLTGVTGGRSFVDAPLQTEPYRNASQYQSAAR
jgi:hypothetical protein